MEASQKGGHGDFVIGLLDLEDLLVKTSEVTPQTLISVLFYAEQVGGRLLGAASSNEVRHEGLA